MRQSLPLDCQWRANRYDPFSCYLMWKHFSFLRQFNSFSSTGTCLLFGYRCEQSVTAYGHTDKDLCLTVPSTVRIQSRVTFKIKVFFFEKFMLAIPLNWRDQARSYPFQCTCITNSNFEKPKLTKFKCGTTGDLVQKGVLRFVVRFCFILRLSNPVRCKLLWVLWRTQLAWGLIRHSFKILCLARLFLWAWRLKVETHMGIRPLRFWVHFSQKCSTKPSEFITYS